MLLTMRQAARAVRRSRPTLYRYAEQGRLSVTLGPNGEKLVDPAELIRVFGPLQPETVTEQAQSYRERHPGQAPETAAELAAARAELAALHATLQATREALEHTRENERRLLGIVENQTRLLEHKPAPDLEALADTKGKKKRRRLLRELLGWREPPA